MVYASGVKIQDWLRLVGDFLKLIKDLYHDEAARDVGSLTFYKMHLRRTNVNGHVKGKFQAHEDFISTMGDALLLKLCLNKMGMGTPEDQPYIPGLPDTIERIHLKKRTCIFHQITGQIVDEILPKFMPPSGEQHVTVKVHVPGTGKYDIEVPACDLENNDVIQVDVPGTAHVIEIHSRANSDDLRNYSLRLLQWYLHLSEFQDGVKEGDITRTNINIKMMIPLFYGYSKRSKYFIECIDYILKTEVLLPEALSVRVRLGSFINSHGGPGKNKAADMQQENNIGVIKDVIRGLGASKTEKSLIRSSMAAPVIGDIVEHYKELLDIKPHTDRHVKKSNAEDVAAILELMNEADPFTHTPGRVMEHFKGINKSVFHSIDRQHYTQNLSFVINRLKRRFNVDPVSATE